MLQPNDHTLKSPWVQTGCPVCGGHDFVGFFSLEHFPVSVAILCETSAEAFSCPTADIHLNFCNCCGYIGNWSFQPESMHYSQSYDITLHHSPLYEQFIRSLVDRLIDTYGIRDKTVVDIGCGKAEFLREVCEKGKNRGIGIDPSAPLELQGIEEIKLVHDLYSQRYADLTGDLVCCRHVLEIVANPRDFLRKIRQGVGRRPDSITYLETPNAEYTFKKGVIWNIAYSNSGYFFPEAMAALAQQTGFEVLQVAPCFNNDQYLGIDLRPVDNKGGPVPALPGVKEHRQEIERFSEIFKRNVSFWQEKIRQIEATRKRVVTWCAGARAISFFCLFDIGDAIPYVVDINPNRQGKFMPVTGQKVVAPEFLREFQPDAIIVTNDTFLCEIQQQVAALRLNTEFLTL